MGAVLLRYDKCQDVFHKKHEVFGFIVTVTGKPNPQDLQDNEIEVELEEPFQIKPRTDILIIAGGQGEDDFIRTELLQLTNTEDALYNKGWNWPEGEDRYEVIGGVLNQEIPMLCFPSTKNCYDAQLKKRDVVNLMDPAGDKRLMSSAGINMNSNALYISGGISKVAEDDATIIHLKSTDMVTCN